MRESRPRDLVRDILTERLPESDVDEVDSDRVTDEVGHLPARDPRGDLDDPDLAVVGDDQLRERDAVLEAERAHCLNGGPLGCLEPVGEERRRIPVDPADAEAHARRPEPVGQREHLGLAVAGDHDPVELEAVEKPLENRLPRRRLRERDVERAFQIARRLEPEHAALTTRICRLQDAGDADRLERGPPTREIAHGRKRRLGNTFLGEAAAHRDLVGHAPRHRHTDRRQPQSL